MDTQALTDAIVSQYQAAFAMFRGGIRAMPAARWDDPADTNRTWRLAWHAIFFTHLYLSTEATFEPWDRALPGFDPHEDPLLAPPDAPVYTPEDLVAYTDVVEALLPTLVPSRPYEGHSGFSWLPISRVEHHLRNIRHLQHHTGQLFERSRASGGGELEWAGRGPAARLVEAPEGTV